MTRVVTILATIVSFVLPSSARAGTMTLFPKTSNAVYVSDDGKIVAGATEGIIQGWIWSASEGLRALWTLPGHPAGLYGYGLTSLSGDGTAMAGGGGPIWQWTAANGVIQHPGRGGIYDLSFDGSVAVGTAAVLEGGVVYAAMRWTVGGDIERLGVLTPGDVASISVSVSNDGRVIAGESYSPENVSSPFRWTRETGMVGLGHVPGTASCSVLGSSSTGAWIVGVCDTTEGFVWNESTGMIHMEGFVPKRVTADGSRLLGYRTDVTDNERGGSAIWDMATGMRLLTDIAREQGIVVPEGMVLEAADMTPDGKHFVGSMTRPSMAGTGFLLSIDAPSVPEPSATVLSLVGLMCLLRESRRRNC